MEGGAPNGSSKWSRKVLSSKAATKDILRKLGEEEKSLFESSPGAASLDKLETVDVKTRKASIDALRVIDRSLDRIHKERAKLGALMSRMEKAIDNLSNVALNTNASRGRLPVTYTHLTLPTNREV